MEFDRAAFSSPSRAAHDRPGDGGVACAYASPRFAAHCPRSSDRRRSRATAGTVASDRQERASGAACSEVGSTAVIRGHPGGRRSFTRRTLPASAPAAVNMALCHRRHRLPRPWASRDSVASPCSVESGRLAAARGRRPTRDGWRPPARPARLSRTLAWELDRAKVAVVSPGLEAYDPRLGTV